MRALRLLLFPTLLALPALLSAQTPVGGAIRVDAAGRLQGPDVAMSPRGDFVVAWSQLRSDNRLVEVFCRLYTADGSPSTAKFLVHRGSTARTFAVRLAMMADGSFVVVFPTPAALLAQRFTARGKPVGGNLVVTRDPVTGFEVGSRGDGSFVVTWAGGFPGVVVRAFGADGQPLGLQVPAVVAPTGGPRLAVGADGSFLVVWVEVGTSSPTGHDFFLQGRRFSADGTPQGESFLISEKLSEDSFSFTGYDTTVDSDGDFFVTWFLDELDPAQPTAFVRRYSPAGVPLDASSLAGHQPAGQEIAASPDGGFVSTWETSIGRTSDVVVRQLGANGAPLGPPVVLGHATYTLPTSPPVAGNGAGSFVVVWPTEARRGGGIELFVRRFRTE